MARYGMVGKPGESVGPCLLGSVVYALETRAYQLGPPVCLVPLQTWRHLPHCGLRETRMETNLELRHCSLTRRCCLKQLSSSFLPGTMC